MPSFLYPYYTDDRSNTVFVYKSPPTYLIEKHVYMFYVLVVVIMWRAVSAMLH